MGRVGGGEKKKRKGKVQGKRAPNQTYNPTSMYVSMIVGETLTDFPREKSLGYTGGGQWPSWLQPVHSDQ